VWSFSPPEEFDADHSRSGSPMSLPDAPGGGKAEYSEKVEDGDSIMCDV